MDELEAIYAEAICDGAECFFPDEEEDTAETYAAKVAQAKSLCAECPVSELCREWGLSQETFGIWGGLTEKERRSENRRRRKR